MEIGKLLFHDFFESNSFIVNFFVEDIVKNHNTKGEKLSSLNEKSENENDFLLNSLSRDRGMRFFEILSRFSVVFVDLFY